MRTERGRGIASPPYPFQHPGVCLVAGSAFSLHDDINRARALYPGAPVIAVNGASREVKAFALVSQHPENFTARGAEWIRHQRRLFGKGFTTHSPKQHSSVDYWWDIRLAGGSAWVARKIAWHMGFDLVILCGCPLVPGNYTGHRPGMRMAKPAVVDELFGQIERDKDWHEGVYSMSGRTMELLRSPC